MARGTRDRRGAGRIDNDSSSSSSSTAIDEESKDEIDDGESGGKVPGGLTLVGKGSCGCPDAVK